jgi:ketosteroid isomerase-like protein
MTRGTVRLFCMLSGLFAIGVLGCATAPVPDAAADRTAIAAVRDAFAAATRAGDVDAILDQYVDDPVVMVPGRPAIEGQGPLREYEQAHNEAFAHPALEYESVELVLAGDWAFDRGVERLTEAPMDGSAPVDLVGKYLTVYRRGSDGGWKIAREIFNSSEDGVGGGSPFLLAQPCMTP